MDRLWNFIEVIMKFFFVKLLHISFTEDKWEALMQFVKFGVVGVSNTLISYVLYSGSLILMRQFSLFPKADYLLAQIVAFVLSVLWSFYWNNKMVFTLNDGEERSIIKSLIKTYISYSFTGLFLNSILLILWVQIIGISEFIAPIINLLVSVPINFLINKFWAFKKK